MCMWWIYDTLLSSLLVIAASCYVRNIYTDAIVVLVFRVSFLKGAASYSKSNYTKF